MENKLITTKKAKKIKGSAINLSLNGLENNYYHWLTECLGRLAILNKANIEPDFYIVKQDLPFQKEWLSILGIKKEKIIQANNELFCIDNLIFTTLINNWKQVQYSKGYDSYRKLWQPKFIGDMYRNLIKNEKESLESKNIYITRANARYRKVVNEQDIIKTLEKYKYEIIDLDKISVKEQISIFKKAKKIIAIHGAGLANLYFAPFNCKLLEIYPNGYYDSSFMLLAHSIGINYNYIISESIDNEKLINPQQRNIFLNEFEFQNIVENF